MNLAKATLTVNLAKAVLTVDLAKAVLTVDLAKEVLTVDLAKEVLTVDLAKEVLTVDLAKEVLTVDLFHGPVVGRLPRVRAIGDLSDRVLNEVKLGTAVATLPDAMCDRVCGRTGLRGASPL